MIAVAYYALLSMVPLLIVSVIALSHFIEQRELLVTIGRYLEWLLPGQSRAIVAELSNFLAHRDVLGPVLLVTMIFFSSLAFTVLESAMSVSKNAATISSTQSMPPTPASIVRTKRS